MIILAALVLLTAASTNVARAYDNTSEPETENEHSTTRVETQREKKVKVVARETEHEREARETNAREEAKTRVEKAKQEAEARKLQVKAERCTEYKDRVAKVVPKLSTGLTTLKAQVDKHYARVLEVYDPTTMSVVNGEQLKTDVDNAKVAAEEAIKGVKPADVTVDCANRNLGVQLDSYRGTVKEARDAVKAYHAALVKFVEALKDATEKTDTPATDTNQETTNEG